MPSWLPNLLNPWSALAAAGVVVPSLLLLYFLKLRRKEVAIASTMLWKKSVQDLQVNTPFQRLRRNLLLLLQLLLLLALLLAFARPVSFGTISAAQNTVILIDRSASMSARDAGGRSRLDEAKRRAADLVDGLRRNARAAVIAFDSSAQVVQPMTGDRQALRNAIDAVGPTDQPTRLKLAYQLAEQAIGLNPEQMKDGQTPVPDLFVYSDGRALDGAELSFKGRVTYERLGDDATGNVAIVALSARRNYERPTEVTVFARLANYGPEPVGADLELSVAEIDPADPSAQDFQSRQVKESAVLLPERFTDDQRRAAEAAGQIARDSVEFRLELTSAAVIRVEQKNKTNDALAVDDRAHVVVPPPRTLAVAVVTEGNRVLELAFGALRLERTVFLTPADYEAKVPQDVDVVVFDGYSPRQLPPTGNFVYFGGVPPASPLRVAKVNGVDQIEAAPRVLDWQRDHPLVRGLNLSRIHISQALRLELPPEAETIVEGTTLPLLTLLRQPRQTHLVCAFDVLESDWPLRPTFQIFVVNAMQFLALGSEMDVREAYAPGSVPRIPRTNLARALDAGRGSIALIDPAGDRLEVRVPETGDVALPALRSVGLYRTDPAVPQYERLAVNLLDANESNVQPSAIAPGAVGETADVELAGKRRVEWWWWLVAAGALPLLMVEWWVYTRRVKV